MKYVPTFESFIAEAKGVKKTEAEKIIFDSPADMAKGIIDYFKQYGYTLDADNDEKSFVDDIKRNLMPTKDNSSTTMDQQLDLFNERGTRLRGAYGLVHLYVEEGKLAVIIRIGKP